MTSRLAGIALVVATFSTAGSASASDRAACVDAVGKGQALMDAHKLIEARAQFLVCAASTCPTILQNDCSTFAIDAERATPTVVVSAKDATGNDIFELNVSKDGEPFLAKLNGAAVAVDPGPHTFRFAWADGTVTERQILVPEGQKDFAVTAVHEPAPVRVVAPPPLPAPVPLVVPAPAPVEQAKSGGALYTAGFVVGGTGLAALIVGGVLGGLTFSEVSTAKGACTPGCSNNTSQAAVDDMSTARTYGNTSTALFVVGGAMVAGGVAMAWFGRNGSHSTALTLTPSVAAQSAGLRLGGSW